MQLEGGDNGKMGGWYSSRGGNLRCTHTHSVFHQFRHGELTLQLRFAEREVPQISKQAKIFAKVKVEEKRRDSFSLPDFFA